MSSLIAYGEMAVTGPQEPSWIENKLHHHLPDLLNKYPGARRVRWYEVFDEYEAQPNWYQHDLALLQDLLAARKLKPVIAERFPLEQASQTHKMIEASAVSGKIVLICNE